jgi:hypothetical protein
MSDKSKTLGGLASRLKDGLAKMNNDAKSKAEGKAPNRLDEQHDATDMFDDDDMGPARSSQKHDHITATDDDITDALIIDGEAEPQQEKKKGGLSKKQKLLLAFGVVVAAVVYTKVQNDALHSPSPSKADITASTPDPLKGATTQQIAGPTFDIEKQEQQDNQPIPISASADHDLGFGSGTNHDPANAPIGNEVLTADLNDQLGNLNDEGEQTLDPFTGAVTPTPKQPSVASISAEHSLEKPVVASQVKTEVLDPKTTTVQEKPSDFSPFAVGGSNSTGLSGTKNQNTDSKKGELVDQSANADVAKLKTNVVDNTGRIVKLETEVSQLKSDLAHQKEPVDAKAKSKTVQKVAQHKPNQSSHAAKPSTPTQRVASAPKATPRPQICVTAVAQAARNCTTCVPHAFISNRGSETMVGQGDYIEGLRVNIVGDRLDLQNAQGDVVHKFWSSPNGCAG